MMTTSLDRTELLKLFQVMGLIRRCEEQLARSHQNGLVHGACHTYVEREAIAAGLTAHLRPDDVVFSTHRGHGHALAKGVSTRRIFAELFGRATGCSQGRGGSMHLLEPEVGLMGTSGIVGPCVLQAVGAGYSFRPLETDQVAEVEAAVEDARQFAEASDWPDPATATRFVFEEPPRQAFG